MKKVDSRKDTDFPSYYQPHCLEVATISFNLLLQYFDSNEEFSKMKEISTNTFQLTFNPANIRKFFLSALLSLIYQLYSAQEIDPVIVYSNMHGIRQEASTFYEVEGYSVFVQIQKTSFDEKGFKKIQKKYSIDKEKVAIDNLDFPGGKIFEQEVQRTEKVRQTAIYFLFPEGDYATRVIGFQTVNTRDLQLEKFLVKALLGNAVPERVYTSMYVDSIKFADRFIILGPACNWMGTHNIQCPYMGQMNWAEFRSLDRAKEMIDAQFDITANRAMGEILEQDTIEVKFEGIDAKAIKTKYKILIPQLIMGGSNILIIYYVVAEVRGKYVACVMSHYTDDVNAKQLPPLLSEVMELKE
jgi:hypothetical protein